ncbi:MAG: hypothetical protein RJA22_1938 [Verrucomicrobiota bacterium]
MNDPSLTSVTDIPVWDDIAPHIDQAIHALGEKDRDVILLRFYRKMSVEDVGKAIGAGEAAAQKRITRAVDKLRRILGRRGVTLSVAGLTATLLSSSTQAAPPEVARIAIEVAAGKVSTSLSANVTHLVQASLRDMALSALAKSGLAVVGAAAVLVPAVGLLIATNQQPRIVYDLSDDFSHATNPNGAWAFGWTPMVGGVFKPIRFQKSVTVNEGVVVKSWQFGPASNPAIYKNCGTDAWDNGQGVFQPGSVWYHAGENNRPENFGVIRFTVPDGCSGRHSIKALVIPHLHPSFAGDTEFCVVTNGVKIAGMMLDAKARFGFTNNFYLQTGDSVDFVIGRGADGDVYASGLKIQVAIEGPKGKSDEKP